MLSQKFRDIVFFCLLSFLGLQPPSASSGLAANYLNFTPSILLVLYTAAPLFPPFNEISTEINPVKTAQLSGRNQPEMIMYGIGPSRLGFGGQEGQVQNDRGSDSSASSTRTENTRETVATAGSNGRDDDNDQSKRNAPEGEPEKNPLLCWFCQNSTGFWVYSCCGRRLCHTCHEGFGSSPKKCPCCGIYRKPRFTCDLCPPGEQSHETDQLGLMAHIYSQHLHSKVGARGGGQCRHCSDTVVVTDTLGLLMTQLLGHCTIMCPFPDCSETVPINSEHAQHFELSHGDRICCPVENCGTRNLGIRPSSTHLQGHMQFHCGFCGENFVNQEVLQAHLTQHIHSYACSTCLGTVLFLSMGERLVGVRQDVQFGGIVLMFQMEFSGEADIIRHIVQTHCRVVCPMCNHLDQGLNEEAMQTHIENMCSRISRVSLESSVDREM